ncbi:MAG: Uncharacterized MFS-type transporter [uncultured Solirubrobacteraceae bacterium]|uniref:Uncharacterized MFS-type transporter n=1 Tax=uncultured Solirubrobacteraceae bacterium TaxID=1162706 RepID=A0A6J4T6Q2_9ACTN|nr:MAG: Uncharacterized MFS-type transporter [uncultured Solirubrobacteraceae bacterium]
MYEVQNAGVLLRLRRGASRRAGGVHVSRTVVLLGLTSMFTDISSEMVAAALPLYLVFGLGLTPLQFGLIDGIQQGAAALVRVAGGFAGDRWRRHKEVATLGYGLSAISRLGFPLVGSALTSLSAVVMVDRVGKGIRTAPRDAMISLSSRTEDLATAFSVHRAMDTAGAMLGPVVAFAVLALAPGGYDAVFVVSFCFAIVGLAILVLFVREDSGRHESAAGARAADAGTRADAPTAADAGADGERPTLRSALGLLGRRRVGTIVAIGSALALATVSDGFIYLTLQQRIDFAPTLLPLLYMGTALVYMVLAVPAGRLADRYGRPRVFLAGYGLLLAVYGLLLVPAGGTVQIVLCLLLFGGYYAATEGVLMAISSALLPAALRGTGLALLVTATSVARIVAAIGFGALWSQAGTDVAVIAFAAVLATAIAVAAFLFTRVASSQDDRDVVAT